MIGWKWFILWLSLLAIPSISWSQPAINYNDAEFKASVAGDVTTLTITNVQVVGSNTGLAVFVYEAAQNVGVTVSTVVFNTSESLTFVNESLDGHRAVQSWYLDGATVTTANVVITLSGAAGASSVIMASAVGLSNVEQAQPGLSNSANCNPCTIETVDITTTAANTMLLTAAKHNNPSVTWSHGAGQTEMSDFGEGGGSGESMSTSYELKAVSGLETLESSASSSGVINMVAIGVNAAVTTTRRRAVNVIFR